MTEHLLKKGTSALGKFVRVWLVVLACVGCVFAVFTAHDHGIAAGLGTGLVMAVWAAIPAAVVVAIAFVAVKF